MTDEVPSVTSPVMSILKVGLWLAVAPMIAVVAVSRLASTEWYVAELAISISLHVAVALFIAAIAARAGGEASLAGAAVLAGLVGIYPWILSTQAPRAPRARVADATMVVVSANTYFDSDVVGELAQTLVAQHADWIVLPEPPPALIDRLAASGYQRVVDTADGTMFGLTVVARPGPRLEVLTATVVYFDDWPLAQVDFRWNSRPATLYGVHLPAPISALQMRQRQAQLVWLRERGASPTPAIVAGDLNTTVVSPSWATLGEHFRRPTGASVATWPATLGPLGLSIDHVLVSDAWVADPPHPFGLRDSDHRGVRVVVGWP